MKVISAITLDELTDVLVDLEEEDDLEFDYEVTMNDNGGVSIECTVFDTEFSIYPLGSGPFYEDFLLSRMFGAHLDPEVLCTEFNSRNKFANATPLTVQLDEDSDDEDVVIIEVEKLVLLEGGVTDKHIKATIRLWCGMLLLNEEFFEGPTVDATDGDEDE